MTQSEATLWAALMCSTAAAWPWHHTTFAGAIIVHCVGFQTTGFPTKVGTMDHNDCHSSFLSLVWVMQMWRVPTDCCPILSASWKWLPTPRGGSQWSCSNEGLTEDGKRKLLRLTVWHTAVWQGVFWLVQSGLRCKAPSCWLSHS